MRKENKNHIGKTVRQSSQEPMIHLFLDMQLSTQLV